jgi:hypothetical protein
MTGYEGWAVVELMGHLRRAGRISEVEQFGTKLLRLDVPVGPEEFVTEFYGGASIYRLRPAAEDVVRAVAEQIGDPRPVMPVSYRLPPPAAPSDSHLDEDDEFLDEPEFDDEPLG